MSRVKTFFQSTTILKLKKIGKITIRRDLFVVSHFFGQMAKIIQAQEL